MNALPSNMDDAAFYDERWAKQLTKPLAGRRLERVASILSEVAALNLTEPRILDLGCGTGLLSGVLRLVGPVTAIDYSSAAVTAAARRFPDVTFLTGDFFQAPLSRGSFDLVVSQEVIEHVDDQAGFVELAHSLLVPGGFFILTTPNAPVVKGSGDWSNQAAAGSLQPKENLLAIRRLRALMGRRFRIRRLYTICPTGRRGFYWLVNSGKLQRAFRPWGRLNGFMKLGLHTVVVAQS